MTSLFKYTGWDYLEDTLLNARLYFAAPAQFNDPFDCGIELDSDYSDNPAALVELLKSVAGDVLKTMGELALRRALANIIDDPFARAAAFRRVQRDYREGGVGVGCFAQDATSIVMWAHYARNHTGVCLGFDTARDRELFAVQRSVTYHDVYPRIRLEPDARGLGMERLLTIKATEWAYEREVRVFREKPGLHSFRRPALRSVTVGLNAAADAEAKLKAWLTAGGYADARVQRVRMARRRFGLGS